MKLKEMDQDSETEQNFFACNQQPIHVISRVDKEGKVKDTESFNPELIRQPEKNEWDYESLINKFSIWHNIFVCSCNKRIPLGSKLKIMKRLWFAGDRKLFLILFKNCVWREILRKCF